MELGWLAVNLLPFQRSVCVWVACQLVLQ